VSKTPISDLLKPTPAPAPQPGPRNPSGVGGWLIVAVLAAALGWVYFNQGDKPKPDPKPDDEKHQVDPEPTPANLDLKKHMLVVIRDKKTLNDDIEYTITMQDDDFWGWAKSSLADVEVLEDDDELAKQFASTLIEKPPLVALVNSESRKVVWCMPLPKGGTDSIRSKLK
jgi:hypothetical protein